MGEGHGDKEFKKLKIVIMKKIIYSIVAIAIDRDVFKLMSIVRPSGYLPEDTMKPEGKDLFVFDLNREQGTFKLLSETDAGPDPSYFCISKKRGLIYAADEVMEFNGVTGGGVTALQYDQETGGIVKVKDLLVPDGGPCFISLTPAEDYLLMASYSSSSIAVVKLDDKGIPCKSD